MTMSTGKRWLMAGLLTCAALAGLAAVAVPVMTRQFTSSEATPAPAVAKPAAKAVEPDTRPRWNELTPTQQTALAPLAAEWNKIEVFRKKKWLEIGNRYVGMNSEEQARIQERMRDWAKLTPEERRVAREIYTRTKKLDASQKSAQWQEYQQLPDEQKKKLAESTPPKKRVSNLPTLPPVSKPAALPKPYEKAVTENSGVVATPDNDVAPLAVPPSLAPPATPTAPTR